MLLYVKHLNKFAQYLRRGACALLLALLASSRAQAENITVPTPRDRAEPLVPRVPPPAVLRLFFFPTTAPFFSTLRQPAWRFWQFLVFLQGGVLFGFLPSLLLPLPAPLGLPALRLSISHLHSAPKKHNGGTVTPDLKVRPFSFLNYL